MDKEKIEQILVEYGVSFTDALADRLMKELKPCEDAISRQAVLDTIESWLLCDDYNRAERHIMRAMQSVLYDLPPVNPQKNIVNNGTMNITL